MQIQAPSNSPSPSVAVPVSGKAKSVDEQKESPAVKAREAETGKDTAVPRDPNTGALNVVI